MDNNQTTTEFKLGPIRVTFNSKDKERYKIIVITLIILFSLGFLLILKTYVLPMLLVNKALFSKIGLKISTFFKIIKGV